MKKEKEENKPKKFKKKPIKIQLMNNYEKDKNAKLFGSTFTNSFHSINKITNNLLNQKMNNIKKPNKFNLTNQSTFIKSTANNKANVTIGNNTYRNNKNLKNDYKMTSSFYMTKEVKNKIKNPEIKNIKKMILNLSVNNSILERNKNQKALPGNSLTFRNNININKDTNIIDLYKRKVVKAPENKINKKELNNNMRKENKNINKINRREVSHKNNFERTKTNIRLKTKKNDANKISRGKSMDKKIQIDKEKKGYNNLYDKYLTKFKERMQKISLNKNYKTDEDIKINNNNNNKQMKNIQKKEIFTRYKTQTNFFKKKKDKKDKENNIKKIILELPKKQTTKMKIEKRKVGKSVLIKRDNEVKKEKGNTIRKEKEKMNQNENGIKVPKRSKSMAKLTDKTKKHLNEDKYDIDYILYGNIKPSKNEDPFDDIDSIVRQIDFDKIRLGAKNIFSTEGNDKYKNYCKNFNELFNKAISNNEQRKSIENDKSNKKSENQINMLQSENTTDSFKKNKINVSFIENTS